MNFRCQNDALVSGLTIATRVLSSRTTQPILEGVLLKANEKGVLITCSDGAVSVVTRIDAEIEEEGSVVLPGRLFLDVARKMPSAELSVSVNNKFVASLKCLGVRMTLAGQDGSLYPALPLISAENSIELPQALLRDMIQGTSFAVANDDPRKVLNGCLLEIQHGEIRMVALDGYRLAMNLSRVSENAPQMQAIIPLKAVQEIGKILDGGEENLASLQIGGGQMMMTLGDTILYSTLIDGEYINYRQILPTEWKCRVRFSTEEFQKCVERAALIAREGKNNLLKIEIGQGEMIITSNSESGDVYERQEVETEGDGLMIAFNVLYVSDILRVLPAKEGYMRFNSPVSPCVVCPVEGDAFEYLMLPVRVTA